MTRFPDEHRLVAHSTSIPAYSVGGSAEQVFKHTVKNHDDPPQKRNTAFYHQSLKWVQKIFVKKD